jgi:hypothetical protein
MNFFQIYWKKDSMVGTITAKDQFNDTERIIQLDHHFARSFRDGLHHFHGHEHKFKVDSHFFIAYHFIYFPL